MLAHGGTAAALDRPPDFMLPCTQGSDQLTCSPPHFTFFFAPACSFTRIWGYIRAGRYQRFTHHVTVKTIELLRRRSSLKTVAEDVEISLSSVNRVLNAHAVPKQETLPAAVSFDEFKANLGGERFQCIVTGPLNRRALDFLPKRTVESIQDYLRSFPGRDKVKYVVMDMNRYFRDVARAFFPNAKIIIARFHIMRFCTQAMDLVRKSVQKQLSADQRRYFKRSRWLLLTHRDKLSDEDKAALDVMLRFSDKLAQSYALMEAFYHFMAAPNRNEAGRDSISGSMPATGSRFLILGTAEGCCETGEITSSTPLTSDFPMVSLRAATTQSRNSKELSLAARTFPASRREFCYLFLYTPTFDKEPQIQKGSHWQNVRKA